MTGATVGLGEPIDPARVTPICPRCFTSGGRDCCLSLITQSVTDPDLVDDERDMPLHRQIDRQWSRRYAADLRAWKRERERIVELLVEALDRWETREALYCADMHSHPGAVCADPRIVGIRQEINP